MTTDVAKQAEQTLEKFTAQIGTYDNDVVAQVHQALQNSTIADIQDPGLSVDEWLEFLETVETDAYLFAMYTDRTGYGDDHETKWCLRHDGEEFVYGTEKTGELYRGEEAERQIQAVIDGYDVHPRPMKYYPIERSSREKKST